MTDFEKIKNKKIEEIQTMGKNICQVILYPYSLIQSREKEKYTNLYRHIIWKYIKDNTDNSLSIIGQAIGDRDHVTVSKGIETLNNEMSINKQPKYISLISNLKIPLEQFYNEISYKAKEAAEIWINFERYYQVSNFGRVRSVDRIVNYKNYSQFIK